MNDTLKNLLNELLKQSVQKDVDVLDLVDKKSAIALVRLTTVINNGLIGKWHKTAYRIEADINENKISKKRMAIEKNQHWRLKNAIDHAQRSYRRYIELECLIKEIDPISPWLDPTKVGKSNA